MQSNLYLLLILYFIQLIGKSSSLNQQSSCTSYINILSSNSQSPCGNNLDNACQSFSLANQTCNIATFDQVIYYFSPGTYSFANLDPFGLIVNKNIQIINQDYSISSNSGSSLTSVIFNLAGSLNSFFRVNSTDFTNIVVNGITFVNSFQDGASVLANNGTGSFSFVNCIFDNCVGKSTGSMVILSSGDNSIQSNLTISNCIYQNSNSSDIDGGFIYMGKQLNASLYIDSSTFTNTIVSSGSIISSNSYDDSMVTITNSIFTNGRITNFRGYDVKINGASLLSNITFSQNSGGGIGFGLYGAQSIVSNCKFTNNINTTAIKYSSSQDPGIQIEDCYFSENSNFQNLGFGESSCITFTNTGLSTIKNCQFINNYAINGGAIYLSSATFGLVSIVNSTFDSNSAQKGGAIYTMFSTLSFNSTNNFMNNYGGSGSAVFCENSDIYIGNDSNLTFKNNTDSNDSNLVIGSNGVTCGSKNVPNECTVYGTLNICNSTDSSSDNNSSSKDTSSSSSKENSSTSSKENSSSSSKDTSSSSNKHNSSDSASKDTSSSSSKHDSSDSSNNDNSGSNGNKNANKNKLSSGAKVAISLSVIVGFIGLVILTIYVLRRNKLRKGYIPISN